MKFIGLARNGLFVTAAALLSISGGGYVVLTTKASSAVAVQGRAEIVYAIHNVGPKNVEIGGRKYVGSQVCASCHYDIYSEYVRTGMGRSMSRVTPAVLRQFYLPATFYDRKLDRHYDIYTRDQRLYESEYQISSGGKEIFRETEQLQWTIGSGANSIGGIVKRGSYLFEAPLCFYTKPKTWAPAPGYEFADYSFSRPILAGCAVCHSGRANPVPNTSGRYGHTPFYELAVGCENCHGPGSAHVKAIESGRATPQNKFDIVNPAKLTPKLANDICMECHEFGDVRIVQSGKTYQDIRPGTPLDHVVSILMVPPTHSSPPRSDQLHQYYSMSLSKCFRASGGKLQCITCHDPHVQPSSQDAPAFYNKRCLVCHTDRSCSLPRVARQRGNSSDNCIGCHMPTRKVTFIAHTSLTNHRILRRPNEPLPDAAFHQTTEALPDLIHLDPAPGEENTAPPLLTLLQAYSELASYDAGYVEAYFSVLDRLSRTSPNNAMVQAGLGSRDLKNGKLTDAVYRLRRSLQIDSSQPAVYGLLSKALEKLGRSDDALFAQRKAVAMDPYNPNLQRSLILLLIERKQYAEAQAAIKYYLKVFPQDSLMRQTLTLVAGRAGGY